MIEYLAAAGLLMIGFSYVLSEKLISDSSAKEMRILLQTSDTGWLLSSRWGAEEFPEFFDADWKGNDRQFYTRLSRRMKGAQYGNSRKLLRKLISIEDARQTGKGGMGSQEDSFSLRSAMLLAGYRNKDDFSGVLAQFLEKRHLERSAGWK
jgi:hypothetical protein